MALKDMFKKKKVDPSKEDETKLPTEDSSAKQSVDDADQNPVKQNKIALQQDSFSQRGTCTRTLCQCVGLKENLRQFCLHRK